MPEQQGIAYISLARGYRALEFTGVEFRVVGWPSDWIAVCDPNPSANIVLGDPFGETGVNIAFPQCQTGNCVTLCTVTVMATAIVPDIVLSVVARDPPSNRYFDCPHITACDAPAYTAICVLAGDVLVNSSYDPCLGAVESNTWSGVKGLYR
ncbi:MAG: hypothetical protein ACE5G2_02785 [Candidatus Krumholzibacteriia bacterium]